MKALIILANGLEECEALITYDLLFRANIDVKLIGLSKEIISSHNVKIIVDETIDNINYQEYDCLILPGGMPGTNNLKDNELVNKMIDYFIDHNKYLAAICAAPSILLDKGLLKNERFVCYPGFEKNMKVANSKVFVDNNIITAKGLGAAIEFAYEIIKLLINEDKAKEILKNIQY